MDGTVTEFDAGTELMIYRAWVLSCPTRVAIWTCIGPLGMYVTEISNTLSVVASTASYHLHVLEDAGLVTITRQGRHRLVQWTGVKMGVVTDDEVRAAMSGSA